MTGIVHIVGAGLAGLSTALRLIRTGQSVRIYEAGPTAGGRCRTFWDPRLERLVDNGNHLLLSGNKSAAEYIAMIGATDLFATSATANFPFVDLQSGQDWTIRMNDGPIPWWVGSKARRIPETGLFDYLRGARLAFSGCGQTVADAFTDRGPMWARFWEPLTLAILNTTPERAAASLLWQAMKETFARGAGFCRPMVAPKGLGTALIDPALAHLGSQGVKVDFDTALRSIDFQDGKARALHFTQERSVTLAPDDRVVLTLPPSRLKSVLPDLIVPRDDASILNAHFLIDQPERLRALAPITGLINAKTHWIFLRGDVVSLTISAADRLGVMQTEPEVLLETLWAEVCGALALGDARYLAGRINKERRATFDQSPTEVAKRPDARTSITNLFLAGDATRTGLPATIEGAIRSGEIAAKLVA